MKLNQDESITKEDAHKIESQPTDAKRPRRSSLPETSTEKAEVERAKGTPDGPEGRPSLADRIIERIRRALSPRSDGGRTTDQEADDESESDAEQVGESGKDEIEVGGDKDRSSKKDKDKKKRTKRLKKSKDKDKKAAKKKKKPRTTSKDRDDVSEKIEYAKEYPDDVAKEVASSPEGSGDQAKRVKPEVVEKVLASASQEPPPLPDVSPPKSPEHQVVAGGDKPTVNVSGQYCSAVRKLLLSFQKGKGLNTQGALRCLMFTPSVLRHRMTKESMSG